MQAAFVSRKYSVSFVCEVEICIGRLALRVRQYTHTRSPGHELDPTGKGKAAPAWIITSQLLDEPDGKYVPFKIILHPLMNME